MLSRRDQVHGNCWRATPLVRGFSLFETIVAMFVLMVAAMTTLRALDGSMRITGTLRDRELALLVAEARLRRLEIEARLGAVPAFATRWTQSGVDSPGIDGETPYSVPTATEFSGFSEDLHSLCREAPDPDNPRFLVKVEPYYFRLHTPARGVAPSWPMDMSMRLVRILVRWGVEAGWTEAQKAASGRQVVLLGFVPDPPRSPDPRAALSASFTFEPSADVRIGVDGTADFTLSARDEHQVPFPDLVCRFDILPGTGNATFRQTGSASVRIANYVTLPNGVRRSTGGACTLFARTRLGGRDYVVARPPDLRLDGPQSPLAGSGPLATP